MLKQIVIGMSALALASSAVMAEPSTKLQAMLDEMTAEELKAAVETVEAKFESTAKRSGYTIIKPMGAEFGLYQLLPRRGELNAPNSTSSGDIPSLTGRGVSFLYNLNPEFAIGGFVGTLSGYKENKIGSSFHSFNVAQSMQMLQLKYKPIYGEKFFIDFDFAIGFMHMNAHEHISDETSISLDRKRSKNWVLGYIISLEPRYRVSEVMTVGLKSGYIHSKFDDMERGTYEESGYNIDSSGAFFAVTAGMNF